MNITLAAGFVFSSNFVEEELELFVGEVDARLFEAVDVEVFEAEDVEDADLLRRGGVEARRREDRVDLVDDPAEEAAVQRLRDRIARV